MKSYIKIIYGPIIIRFLNQNIIFLLSYSLSNNLDIYNQDLLISFRIKIRI